MGAHDAAEMLVEARAECVRLERENAQLAALIAGARDEAYAISVDAEVNYAEDNFGAGQRDAADQLTKLLDAAPLEALAAQQAKVLDDAAAWLDHGEWVSTVAFDGPSNRGEVVAAWEAALEEPQEWLRARAAAIRTPQQGDPE